MCWWSFSSKGGTTESTRWCPLETKATQSIAGAAASEGPGVENHGRRGTASGDERGAAKLLESGRLAIVQGVGYPNPDRSHFASMAIWQTARLDRSEHGGLGWLGRGLDVDSAAAGQSGAIFVGSGSPPVALRGRRSATASLERLDDLRLDAGVAKQGKSPEGRAGDGDLAAFVRRSTLDAYTTADRMGALARSSKQDGVYPDTPLAQKLALVAQLLKGGFAARVYYTAQSGYDTHAGQVPVHASLLSELSGALLAFLDDLNAAKLADRVSGFVLQRIRQAGGGERLGRHRSRHGGAGVSGGARSQERAGGSDAEPVRSGGRRYQDGDRFSPCVCFGARELAWRLFEGSDWAARSSRWGSSAGCERHAQSLMRPCSSFRGREGICCQDRTPLFEQFALEVRGVDDKAWLAVFFTEVNRRAAQHVGLPFEHNELDPAGVEGQILRFGMIDIEAHVVLGAAYRRRPGCFEPQDPGDAEPS